MNGEKLLGIMSEVDGKLIEEAEKKPKRKVLYIGAGLAALAAAAAVSVITFTANRPFEEPPALVLDGENFMGTVGYGMEAISESDLENGNPWSENMKIQTMPVFMSSSTHPDGEKMKEILMEAADFFDLDLTDSDIEDSTFGEEEAEALRAQFKEYGASEEEIDRVVKNSFSMGEISASKNGISLRINTAFTLDISFDSPIELPAGYNFGFNASEDELSRAGDYLIEEYGGLLNMKNPVKNLFAEYRGSVEYYDGGTSIQEAITDYSLNIVRFISDENGGLRIIRIYSSKGCEKIGDYPVMTAEEAKTLLFEGNYLTSVPEELSGNEEIGRTELTYRSGIGYEHVMPFYRFLVKLPEKYWGDREALYGAYYVCAVKKEYIAGKSPQISYNGSIISK